MDFTLPPVRHTAHELSCINDQGKPDHILLIEVHPSELLHRNHKGEVFQRFGDQSRRLRDEESRELAFDKGERPFDGQLAPDARIDELDSTLLNQFSDAVGTGSDYLRALRVRGMLLGQGEAGGLTWAAVLLFGSQPQSMLPGAVIRFVRYDGSRAESGTRLNIIFDRRVEGPLPQQILSMQQLLTNQLREISKLDDKTGRFTTQLELPRFAWLEAIVNAAAHRSYSAQGDHIRVSLFDDRLEVESPGRLPGPVRIDNIRKTRFSRNPRISRALSDLGIVKELNEGVNRMFEEMELAGLPEPLLQQTESGFKVTLFNRSEKERGWTASMLNSIPEWFHPVTDRLVRDGQITTGQVASTGGVSQPTARRALIRLVDAGLLTHVATSAQDPRAFWKPTVVLVNTWHRQTRR